MSRLLGLSAKPVRSRFARLEFPDPDPADPAHLVHDRTRTEFQH